MFYYTTCQGTLQEPIRDGVAFKFGKWEEVTGKIEMFKNGFYCCPTIQEAINLGTDILAEVEIDSDAETFGTDLMATRQIMARKMRILRTTQWTSLHSLDLAIFCFKKAVAIIEKAKTDEQNVNVKTEEALLDIREFLHSGKDPHEILEKYDSIPFGNASSEAYSTIREAVETAIIVLWAKVKEKEGLHDLLVTNEQNARNCVSSCAESLARAYHCFGFLNYAEAKAMIHQHCLFMLSDDKKCYPQPLEKTL